MGKKEILAQVKKHDVCALATCLNNKPEAAAVSFVVDDNFVFYLVTSKFYRKYRNLARNKNVSLVIGFGIPTVQVDGKAEFLKSSEIELIRPFIIEKLPDTEDFLKQKDMVFIKIKPTYLRMTKFILGEYKIEELKF